MSIFRLLPQDVPLIDQAGRIFPDQYDRLKQIESGLLSPKIIIFTRLLSLGVGNQSVNGLGFQPTFIQWQSSTLPGNAFGCLGYSDGVSNVSIESVSGSFNPDGGVAIRQRDAVANFQAFTLASFDPDGFTVTWTKSGAPTATAFIIAICHR